MITQICICQCTTYTEIQFLLRHKLLTIIWDEGRVDVGFCITTSGLHWRIHHFLNLIHIKFLRRLHLVEGHGDIVQLFQLWEVLQNHLAVEGYSSLLRAYGVFAQVENLEAFQVG